MAFAPDTGAPESPGGATPSPAMSDAMDQLALLKRARQQDREDLQQITDGFVGAAAATILAFNQAKLVDALLGPVDVPEDVPEAPPSPFQPATESTS